MDIVVGAEAAEVLRGLTRDELVSGPLVLHDLHPLGTEGRVRAALSELHPALGPREGGVELIGVDPGGVVRLRLSGGSHGCASSRATVAGAVERAVLRAAPEVTRLEVEAPA